MTVTAKDHFTWEDSGRAIFDGQDLAEIADAYPTPCYLFSQRQLRDNFRQLQAAFSGVEGLRTYYSVKSNFESITLRTLAEEGSGAEVSGALDLELARRAGIRPANVVYDGPYKPTEDIRAALGWGVHLINIESMTEAKEIDRVAADLGRKVDVGIRIDPLLSKPYYDKVISTYRKKFGFPIDQTEAAAVEIAKLPHLNVVGLMTHIGSQVFHPTRYLQTLDKMFDLIGKLKKQGIEIRELNVGGGYPAQSMRNLRLSRRFVIARILERMGRIDVQASSIADFGSQIGERFVALTKSTGFKPTLAIEPGRCLVSNAGMILGRILIMKNDWVFTDISINNLPENLLFSEWRMVFPGQSPAARGRPYNISGPTLATQDVHFFQREVPDVEEGDPVAILDTGAYSIARANQFTRPRIAAYAILENGDVSLVRRAETVEDVLNTQVWPSARAQQQVEPAARKVRSA
jgi:diaminopimelate decarboxylase